MNHRAIVIACCAIMLFVIAPSAQAQDTPECDKVKLTIVFRDGAGNFVPGISYEVFEQIEDVDGHAVPGKRVGSGKVNATTGRGELNITGTGGRYALNAWHLNKAVGSFWFWDIDVGCGGAEVTERLSSLQVILRGTDETLIKNQSFSLYTQRYDVDEEPIRETDDFIGTLNTSEEGIAVTYLPDETRQRSGAFCDHYVFESTFQGVKYQLYDLVINDGQIHELEYVYSDLELTLLDEDEVPYPGGTKIEFFRQTEDANGDPALGTKIKDLLTNDRGVAVVAYPFGTYAARIAAGNGGYEYFYDLEIEDQDRSRYTLTPGGTYRQTPGACTAATRFSFTPRTLDGAYIPGLKYELVAVGTDVNGTPVAKAKLAGGTVDSAGRGESSIRPDPRVAYALKVYDRNATVGAFWFFDDLKFVCGQDRAVEKALPALRISFRTADNALIKNQAFSLYTQKHDIDGRPIAEAKDLVAGSLTTGETGEITVYLGADHPHDPAVRGLYLLQAVREGQTYREYGLTVDPEADRTLPYMFSRLSFTAVTAAGSPLAGRNVDLYRQERGSGGLKLGAKLKSVKTNAAGEAAFDFPSGTYAVAVADDLNKPMVFWSVAVKNRAKTVKTFTTNVVRISAKLPDKTAVNIYALTEAADGRFVKGAKLKTVPLMSGNASVSLASGPYLFTVVSGKLEYGRALWTENKLQDLALAAAADQLVSVNKSWTLAKPAGAGATLADRLAGRILLQVEGRGEAWYVDPDTKQRYYLKDGPTAYEFLRRFGLGVTNTDLRRVPVALDTRLEPFDYDGDEVSDQLEEALGLDHRDYDTDGDGYDDGQELAAGFDPKGSGTLPIDAAFVAKHRGRIFLQVDSRGEAWYLDPAAGKRYYMSDGNAAYEIMRYRSLGITNADLDQIDIGT